LQDDAIDPALAVWCKLNDAMRAAARFTATDSDADGPWAAAIRRAVAALNRAGVFATLEEPAELDTRDYILEQFDGLGWWWWQRKRKPTTRDLTTLSLLAGHIPGAAVKALDGKPMTIAQAFEAERKYLGIRRSRLR
jgi:hypothetical protein